MGYLNDFIHYGSGTECPDIYLQWSGLSLLGAVLGRKVWTMHGGYFRIHPKLYVCLVGDAGSGKSTAKNQAKQFLKAVDPDYLVSSSFQSHQDIIDKMANEVSAVKTWKNNATKTIQEYRVFYGICNELASLLSTDKKGMVEFLVDVFDDEDDFTTGFKTGRLAQPERKQIVPFPYVSILACAVPKWFMGNLKLDLFDGGLGRRLIVCYSNKTHLNPNPQIPAGGAEAKLRALDHLRLCKSEAVQGELHKTASAEKWWNEWYMDPKRFNLNDPIISQFHQTKHIQVLKIASLLTMCETPFTMQIEDVHLQAAVRMLDILEPNISKLTSGIGRNELAGIGAMIVDYINQRGGAVREVHLLQNFRRYANTTEFTEIVASLQKTEELMMLTLSPEGVPRTYYMTREGYEDMKRSEAAKREQPAK